MKTLISQLNGICPGHRQTAVWPIGNFFFEFWQVCPVPISGGFTAKAQLLVYKGSPSLLAAVLEIDTSGVRAWRADYFSTLTKAYEFSELVDFSEVQEAASKLEAVCQAFWAEDPVLFTETEFVTQARVLAWRLNEALAGLNPTLF